MSNQILILAKQDHIENGNLSEKYLTPVFESLIKGESLYIDSKEFTNINIENEIVKQVESEKKQESDLTKVVTMLYNQCNVNGYMAVEDDNIQLNQDDIAVGWSELDALFNRIAFEYDNHSNGGYGEEMIEEGILTERQSQSYLNKLKKFIVKYAPKHCNAEHANKLVKEFK